MPRPDQATIDARINEAEASAPAAIEDILAILPEAVADAVRIDVASRELLGVRSPEHDRVVGLCFAARDRIQTGDLAPGLRLEASNVVVRSLCPIGYHAGTLLAWLRATNTAEPNVIDPRNEVVMVPVIPHLQANYREREPHLRVRTAG